VVPAFTHIFRGWLLSDNTFERARYAANWRRRPPAAREQRGLAGITRVVGRVGRGRRAALALFSDIAAQTFFALRQVASHYLLLFAPPHHTFILFGQAGRVTAFFHPAPIALVCVKADSAPALSMHSGSFLLSPPSFLLRAVAGDDGTCLTTIVAHAFERLPMRVRLGMPARCGGARGGAFHALPCGGVTCGLVSLHLAHNVAAA